MVATIACSRAAEGGGEGLEFLVPGVAQDVLVKVPDQVNEAFLLRAIQRVVGGVEVRNQHAPEVFEQVMQEVSLP